jgi:predicted nucleic acid-binding protein
LPLAVVDASAVAAILFGEPAADDIVRRLGARELAAPSLLPYEIVSVAGGKVRRGEIPAETAAMALEAFVRVSIALHDPDCLEVFRLTVRTRLTAYDAVYLSLAHSLSADLVTLDAKLAGAWSRLARPRGRR